MGIFRGKGKWLFLFTCMLVLGTAMTSIASGNIKIRFDSGNKSDWTEDVKEPVVTINNSTEIPEWNRPVDEWEPGKKVTATFTVSGEYTKSKCDVYGGELVSVNSSDGETTIKASYIPTAKLGGTEQAGWSDETHTTAVWRRVPYASKYQVRLYRGDQWTKTLTTTSNTIDLAEYMESGYSYYYEVRAISADTAESQYLADGDFVVSDNSVVQDLGATSGRWTVLQNGKRYQEASGSYLTKGWHMVDGQWYYFDEDGFVQTGWKYVGDKWYYLNSDGQMLTGWQHINDRWYYLNDNGDMAIGWVQSEPGKWYYLYTDVSMAVNTTIDGLYYVDSSGMWMQ